MKMVTSDDSIDVFNVIDEVALKFKDYQFD